MRSNLIKTRNLEHALLRILNIDKQFRSSATLGIVIACLLIGANSTLAQGVTPVYVDVSQCRNINVDLARVACYDTLADIALKKAASGKNQALVPQNNINRQMRQDNWIMREELARLRKESNDIQEGDTFDDFGKRDNRIVNRDDGKRELFDRIVSLKKSANGWLVTLESGQVWRQMNNKRYALREGQEVRIFPSIWGDSYRLSVKKLGSFIQVERLR